MDGQATGMKNQNGDDSMNILKITKVEFETWGSHSLIGKVLTEGFMPGPLTLSFEQSSPAWVKENDGPDMIIMPEYTPMCLVEDIISLTKRGYEIAITEYYGDKP